MHERTNEDEARIPTEKATVVEPSSRYSCAIELLKSSHRNNMLELLSQYSGNILIFHLLLKLITQIRLIFNMRVRILYSVKFGIPTVAFSGTHAPLYDITHSTLRTNRNS
ncbi:hypothetical protein EVAR_57424_1 [Eumeta japonica]|uniref:Uncharacterized protein n=1 Tax=Eumeta variegata TaxID=151549 RepID=A0A4C1YA88_EUMVA|nr:hypothetical protein EVAR_57424_1 [Eumeta japonica]